MTISHLDIAIVAIYLCAVLGLGIYQARKIRTSGDYYAGGRKFNKFYLMMHAPRTASHADEPVSVIGGGDPRGLGGNWDTDGELPPNPPFWRPPPPLPPARLPAPPPVFPPRPH